MATVGITNYAQEQLGDLVFVELPKLRRAASRKSEAVAVVKSVKAASDVYSPLTGEVVAVNDAGRGRALRSSTQNEAEKKAWLFKIRIASPAELDGLMDETAYRQHIA